MQARHHELKLRHRLRTGLLGGFGGILESESVYDLALQGGDAT